MCILTWAGETDSIYISVWMHKRTLFFYCWLCYLKIGNYQVKYILWWYYFLILYPSWGDQSTIPRAFSASRRIKHRETWAISKNSWTGWCKCIMTTLLLNKQEIHNM